MTIHEKVASGVENWPGREHCAPVMYERRYLDRPFRMLYYYVCGASDGRFYGDDGRLSE